MRGLKSFLRVVLPAFVVGAISTTAGATLIINDSFDLYSTQGAFEAVWTPIATGTPASAELSTAQSVSPTQSVRVPGTATSGQSRNRQSFVETGIPASNSNVIIWRFDFYDSNSAAAPYRNYSNLHDTTAPAGTNQLISMGMNNNQSAANSGGNYYMARILGYTVPVGVGSDPDGGPDESVGGAAAYFKLNDFASAPLRSTGWHKLEVHISTDDDLSTDYEFFVDGIFSERVSNIGSAATLRSYDNIALGSGVSNASNESFFDNMYLATVPEPTSSALLGLGGLTLLGRRRRRA